MTHAKHTPGTWRFVETETTFQIDSDNKIIVMKTSWHSRQRGPYPLREEARANARLTSAAPELLDALRLFEQRVLEHGNWDDGCFYYGATSASELQGPLEKARKAIAKATGDA